MNETTTDMKSQLMEGYEKTQFLNLPAEDRDPWIKERPLRTCRWILEDTARRVAASKANFPHCFFRGDCHSHTEHSDGIGTVAETADMVKAAGFDFQFVTDHWGITQAPECREHGLWVGQEPVTKHHHMGILGLDRAFTPQMDFLADYAAAVETGATIFIPHPTGWWPSTVYNQQQKQILEELPSPFLMEICNGANNGYTAFDYTDESAIELWDHLLTQGRKVHAMGNTDAHEPHALCIVWNSVFAEKCDQQTILAELQKGHSFVSDAPLIHIALGEARMGDEASARDRESEFEITVADSRGLAWLRVIADGQEIFERSVRGETEWRQTVTVPTGVKRYIRAEVHSRDARRAYSNPIYLS
jgi:hypothetical protein